MSESKLFTQFQMVKLKKKLSYLQCDALTPQVMFGIFASYL